MRSLPLLCLAALLASCASRPEAAPPFSAPLPAPFAAPKGAQATAPASLPQAEGPVRIVGYPLRVGSGFAAVALAAGFTRDGAELGVCWTDGATEGAHCRLQDRAGIERTVDVPIESHPGKPDRIDPKAAHGLPRLRHVGPAAYDFEAPPLVGTWPFGRDMVIHVVEEKGKLRVGGSVRGRPAVFPVEIQRPPVDALEVRFIRPNAVAFSPDGRELGLVVHSATQEYDATYTFHRLPIRAFAARVHALSAADARRAGEADAARELCALATAIDPKAAAGECGG
jgi:hypothetical protein